MGDYAFDEQLVQNSEVDLRVQLNLHFQHVRNVIEKTDTMRPNGDTWKPVRQLAHRKVLLLGLTGQIGCVLARYLAFLGAEVYCVVRDSGGFGGNDDTAEERFEEIIEEFGMSCDKHLFHLVKSRGYRYPRFGLSDEQWKFLCEEMDVIFGFGARTTLNMQYDKAVKGVLNSSLLVMELARTHHIKPVVTPWSCSENCCLIGEVDTGLARGYALSKRVDRRGWQAFRLLTGHPLRLFGISYILDHAYNLPSTFNTYQMVFKFAFELEKFCPLPAPLDFVDVDDAVMAIMSHSKFDPKLEPSVHWEIGLYGDPQLRYTLTDFCEMMEAVNPNMKRVDGFEYQASLQEYGERPYMKPFAVLFKLANSMVNFQVPFDYKIQHLFCWNEPGYNLHLPVPSREDMIKLLTYIKNRPLQLWQQEISWRHPKLWEEKWWTITEEDVYGNDEDEGEGEGEVQPQSKL